MINTIEMTGQIPPQLLPTHHVSYVVTVVCHQLTMDNLRQNLFLSMLARGAPSTHKLCGYQRLQMQPGPTA
jgi:hypothetical protein